MASAEICPSNLEPSEKQVEATLDLLADLMSSEQQLYIRTEIAKRWPVGTEHLAEALPRIEITRGDLLMASFVQDEIDQLTDADLLTISRTMRDHYVYDVFWPEVEYVTEGLLEQKRQQSMRERLAGSSVAAQPFYAWMTAIEQHIWAVAGCSIYDLPGDDFQAMFTEGMSPAEVVNQVLEKAGFDFEGE